MSAPLHFPEPLGDVSGFIKGGAPMLGWHMTGVRADALRPGQFTTFDGYRCNPGVEVLEELRGRGKNRKMHVLGVRLTRCDGTTVTLDPDTELEVYAP